PVHPDLVRAVAGEGERPAPGGVEQQDPLGTGGRFGWEGGPHGGVRRHGQRLPEPGARSHVRPSGGKSPRKPWLLRGRPSPTGGLPCPTRLSPSTRGGTTAP